jgi:hypothetical protein
MFRNLFFTRGTPWFVKDTWLYTTKFRLAKRGYETFHGHKYVSTYKSLHYKNAGIWRQNLRMLDKAIDG